MKISLQVLGVILTGVGTWLAVARRGGRGWRYFTLVGLMCTALSLAVPS